MTPLTIVLSRDLAVFAGTVGVVAAVILVIVAIAEWVEQ